MYKFALKHTAVKRVFTVALASLSHVRIVHKMKCYSSSCKINLDGKTERVVDHMNFKITGSRRVILFCECTQESLAGSEVMIELLCICNSYMCQYVSQLLTVAASGNHPLLDSVAALTD